MAKISVFLSHETHCAAKAVADQKKISLTAWVAHLIQKALAGKKASAA